MTPQLITDSFVPVCAGLFVSLVNKYIQSNPKLDACCTTVEPEELDNENDSNETTKTEMSDTLGKAPGTTTATLPISHRIHTTHHIYYYTHQ